MNSTLKGVFMFITGAAIGSVVTWKLLDKKLSAEYEQRFQEEVKSTKDAFARRAGAHPEEVETDEEEEEQLSDVDEYEAKLKEENYLNYSNAGDVETEEEVKEPVDIPYVITPDDFGEFDDYERISLIYYADGVLADDCDELVDDVDEIVGEESLTHFGEYEDDSVFVRNDAKKCDYEILLDQRKYSDVIKTKPHLRMED